MTWYEALIFGAAGGFLFVTIFVLIVGSIDR